MSSALPALNLPAIREKAKPAMVVSATMGTSPTLIYFGQEVGEPGAQDAGFGKQSRTSIFDYVGVPHHQQWMNEGKFDGAKLSRSDSSLRDFYKRLLNFTKSSAALAGSFADLHSYNRANTTGYTDKLYSFARWGNGQKLVVVSNFSHENMYSGSLVIPANVIREWRLKDGTFILTDKLYETTHVTMIVSNVRGSIQLSLQPLESLILALP